MRGILPALLGPAVWITKSIVYIVVFRLRKIPATTLSCFIIAGAPYLLSMIPIPLLGFLSVPVAIGLAVYLTMHYTRVELIPDGLFIPLSIEVFFRISLWGIQELSSLQ